MNPQLAFDTEILLDDNKNEKVLLDLKIDGKKQTKKFLTKILKMDENNQYGHAMMKPLPYGCIKKQKHPPSLVEFKKNFDRISHDNNIRHLFIIEDIKFYDINHKTLLFRELYNQKWNRLNGLLFS